jgi:phage shock protein PspC (stress-responsive transcriptional regulator)
MRKLYRSSHDRMLFGVCGGLAEYFGVEATLLRILLVVIAVFSAGSIVFVYLIAALIIPREPRYLGYGGPYGPGPHPGHGGPDWRHGPATPPPYTGGQNPSWSPGGGSWNGQWSGAGNPPGASQPPRTGSPIDAMMDDIEKKALKREIEELKARIAQFEKQGKSDKQEKGE